MKVFLHGWGMRKEMFSLLIEAYYPQEEVICLSLPGYDGESETQEFDQQVVLLSDQIPQNAHIIGWSLGGLFALRMAQLFPDKVLRLTLMCSSPLFVKKEDWSFGLDSAVLGQFGTDLMVNRGKTITQFMLLQLHGQKDIKSIIRELNNRIKECPKPPLLTLQAGLKYLQEIDLRESLISMKTDVCFIFGGRDRIVLSSQIPTLRSMGGHIEVHVIKSAGHMPFITHMKDVAALL